MTSFENITSISDLIGFINQETLNMLGVVILFLLISISMMYTAKRFEIKKAIFLSLVLNFVPLMFLALIGVIETQIIFPFVLAMGILAVYLYMEK